MPQPANTVAEFLAVIRRSGLVDADRLASATTAWTDPEAPLPEELPRSLVAAGLLTDWQVGQLRKGRYKGFMLGKYRLLQLLGAGGMSSVYLAENTTLHQRVAIKVLPIKRVEQSSFLARFRREAQMAFRLSHQNVARAFDLDQVGEIHFIVMEYVDGIDLHAKVKQQGPLPVHEAVEYLRQAALGLHHAHEEGLVHRDVKPSNLILDRKGTVKILDLGLAFAGDDEEAASITREHDERVLGTADYLAPEQATDSHTADRRSDIYALGCTLHYLLVGKAPFAQGKLAERVQAHVKKPPPNIVEERAEVPLPIAQLYFRMMEKHPEARPQTALEVADALSAWLAANPPGMIAASAAPPRRGPPRRPSGGSGPVPVPVLRNGPGSSSSSVSLGVPRRPSAPRRPGSPSGVRPADPGGHKPASSPAVDAPVAASPQSASTEPTPPSPGRATPRISRRQPREFAGLPLGYWLTLAVGLITVSVLGTLLWLRNR
jgi:eukaryotic-like serine/threonine-protein kinase